MDAIIRIISIFIGLFIVVNGIWIILTPPYGDEPLAGLIIVAGIALPLIVQYFAMVEESREA